MRLNFLLSVICHEFADCAVKYMNCSLYESMIDVIFVTAYVSPAGSKIYDCMDKNNGIKLLSDKIEYLSNHYPDYYIFLAGDLNARTKNFLDFIPNDNLFCIYNIDVDSDSDYFEIPRNNRDPHFNTFGHSLIELCFTFNIHMLNGRCLMILKEILLAHLLTETTILLHLSYFFI